ncbi:hypothetical protein WME88_48855 [Sorangium sp. So ce216]
MATPTPSQVESFYRAGVLGLRALEAREGRGRRLGPAADATWRAFRGEPGELDDRDRLDLLLRDAAATYPLAFAPRRIFALAGLADDEPFGHEWPGLPVSLARPLLRDAADNLAPRPARGVLAEVASAWGFTPDATLAGEGGAELAGLGPASRVAASGAGAVLILAEHFASRRDLDLGDQVLFVTDRPGERQLFGLAVALLGSATAPRVALPAVAHPDGARALGFDRLTAAIVSDDADAGARDAALELRYGGDAGRRS